MSRIDTGENPRLAELLEVERDRNRALVAGDKTSLEALLADDLTYTHSNGHQDTKASYLASLGERVSFLVSRRSDLRVRFYGDVAVMTGQLHVEGRAAGSSDIFQVDAAATQVWVDLGGWQMTAWHSAPVPPR